MNVGHKDLPRHEPLHILDVPFNFQEFQFEEIFEDKDDDTEDATDYREIPTQL